MTSQGTAHGRFQRAIRDRHLRRAEMAARELGELALPDAYRSASFWLSLSRSVTNERRHVGTRVLLLEAPGISLTESFLALLAAQALGGPQRELAARTQRQLASSHGLSTVAAVLRSPR